MVDDIEEVTSEVAQGADMRKVGDIEVVESFMSMGEWRSTVEKEKERERKKEMEKGLGGGG